jgi:hypothetical protein
VQERGKCESGMGRVILGGLPQIAPKTFFSDVNFEKFIRPKFRNGGSISCTKIALKFHKILNIK